MDDKEDLLERIRESLKVYQEQTSAADSDRITIDLAGISADPTEGYSYSNMSVGDITIGSGIYTTTSGLNPNVYISSSPGSTTGLQWDDTITFPRSSGTISLTGENADIDINGRSLVKTLDALADRLNVLVPDPRMEAEWDELRSLREAYDRKLEECREKSKMWKTLKDMPPPEIK